MIGFGQLTMIPDANFEQKLINLGYDNGAINGSVYTALINTVTYLDISFSNISDLTGIEDFTALNYLHCSNNQLTSLDVSNNTDLTELFCDHNGLTSLDVSGATALEGLHCPNNSLTSLDVSGATALEYLDCQDNNQLTSLDVSNNTDLTELFCGHNGLTSLDVSGATALEHLDCAYNSLTSLDVRNGNNINMYLISTNNPNLICISVDDPVYAAANWTNIDPQHYFSHNCSGTSIQEHTTNNELLKVTDLLGRETKQTNQPLFYIYDDGIVEKRIVIE